MADRLTMCRFIAQSVASLRTACALGAVLSALACGLPREPALHEPVASDELRYTVTLAEDLQRADVVVCSENRAPFTLRPGRDEAGVRLLYARLLTPTPIKKLPAQEGVIAVPAGTGERCIGYGVHLRDGGRLASLVSHVEGGLVSSVNAWLWRPEQRSPGIRAQLRFVLPPTVQAFPPYPRAKDGAYLLDARAFRFDAYVVFGRAQAAHFAHGGMDVHTVTLANAISADDLDAWLSHHLDALSPLKAAFPGRELVVLALPSDATATPFGCVTRGGIPSVLVFVPRGTRLDALRENWVLTHELSHFALPFVRRDDAWASEGFATYYQEVLRSRAKQRPARAVAEDLYREFERVEREVGTETLDAASREMEHTGHYRGVYWAGAAVFFELDVALRRAQPSRDLADVVAHIDVRDARDSFWTASQLMNAIDGALGQALAAPLTRAAIARPFPDFRATFAAIGITEVDGALRFDEPARALRAQIFGAE